MNGSKIAAFFAMVVSGVVIADILIHPEGTKAAANGVSTILTPTYSALLGGANVQRG
jgi:hypothetical protein